MDPSFRTLLALEHFAATADLGRAQKDKVVTPNVAMEIFTLQPNSAIAPVRGFASSTATLTEQSVQAVISAQDDSSQRSTVETAIFLSDEVLQIARDLEGVKLIPTREFRTLAELYYDALDRDDNQF